MGIRKGLTLAGILVSLEGSALAQDNSQKNHNAQSIDEGRLESILTKKEIAEVKRGISEQLPGHVTADEPYSIEKLRENGVLMNRSYLSSLHPNVQAMLKKDTKWSTLFSNMGPFVITPDSGGMVYVTRLRAGRGKTTKVHKETVQSIISLRESDLSEMDFYDALDKVVQEQGIGDLPVETKVMWLQEFGGAQITFDEKSRVEFDARISFALGENGSVSGMYHMWLKSADLVGLDREGMGTVVYSRLNKKQMGVLNTYDPDWRIAENPVRALDWNQYTHKLFIVMPFQLDSQDPYRLSDRGETMIRYSLPMLGEGDAPITDKSGVQVFRNQMDVVQRITETMEVSFPSFERNEGKGGNLAFFLNRYETRNQLLADSLKGGVVEDSRVTFTVSCQETSLYAVVAPERPWEKLWPALIRPSDNDCLLSPVLVVGPKIEPYALDGSEPSKNSGIETVVKASEIGGVTLSPGEYVNLQTFVGDGAVREGKFGWTMVTENILVSGTIEAPEVRFRVLPNRAYTLKEKDTASDIFITLKNGTIKTLP